MILPRMNLRCSAIAGAQSVSKERGFTLLELLVAMMLFAIVSLMAYSGLGQMVRVKSVNDAASTRLSELQMVWLFLHRDLAQLVVRPVRGGYGDVEPAMLGGAEDVAFTRGGLRSLPGLIRVGVQRVAYGIEDGVLYRRHWRVLDRDFDSQVIRSPMLPQVEQMSVRYLDGDHQWQTVWPSNSDDSFIALLPLAMEVTLTLQDRGAIRRLFELPERPYD